MPRPGVDVDVVDIAAGSAPILDTGQGFFVGATEIGPEVDRAASAAEFKTKWGARVVGATAMYDAVLSFFDEGGSAAIISRVASTTAVKATALFGTGLIADAISGGLWGNTVTVVALTPPGGAGTAGDPIQISVRISGVEKERSRTVATPADAIAWAKSDSDIIRFRVGAGAAVVPTTGVTATLATGTAGAALAPTDYQTALGRFQYQMGPGQVGMPGITDTTVMGYLGQHLEDQDRVAVVDLADTGVVASLQSARNAFNNMKGARLMLAMGHWLLYPTETPPATQLIPYSGVQMGMIARVDAQGDPSAVAAGSNAISRRALGMSYEFTDTERQALNANGVNLGRQFGGLVRTYGYRSGAGVEYNLNWTFFQESRVVMAIAHEANAAVEEYVFDTIDGFNHLFVHVKNVLVGICMRYFDAGALYGASPQDAFRIDMSVNTIATIALGEVHAAIYLKTSKVAEWVQISIIKVPVERALAVAA